jgi:hypothetical protein
VIPIIPIIQTVDPKFLLVVGVSYNFKISQFRQRDPNRFNTKIDKIDIQIDSKYIQIYIQIDSIAKWIETSK